MLTYIGMVVCLNLADVKRFEAGDIRPKSQGNSCLVLDKRHEIVAVRKTRQYLAVTLKAHGHQIINGYAVKPKD